MKEASMKSGLQTKLPSSAEEGKAEAFRPRLGWCWSKEIDLLANTTPSAFLLMLRPIGLALRSATPPQLRRGLLVAVVFVLSLILANIPARAQAVQGELPELEGVDLLGTWEPIRHEDAEV